MMPPDWQKTATDADPVEIKPEDDPDAKKAAALEAKGKDKKFGKDEKKG